MIFQIVSNGAFVIQEQIIAEKFVRFAPLGTEALHRLQWHVMDCFRRSVHVSVMLPRNEVSRDLYGSYIRLVDGM